MNYPHHLENLIQTFQKLPGIGRKASERFALHLLYFRQDLIEEFQVHLSEILKTKFCSQCFGFCFDVNDSMCHICEDPFRNKEELCVVETYRDLLNFEQTGEFRGTYHILKGRISPSDGVEPDSITVPQLIQRVQQSYFKEIIFALSSGIEGDITTQYILHQLGDLPDVSFSQLARGIPLGMSLEHVESFDIINAFRNRESIHLGE